MKTLIVICRTCGQKYKVKTGHPGFSCRSEKCKSPIIVNWDKITEHMYIDERNAPGESIDAPDKMRPGALAAGREARKEEWLLYRATTTPFGSPGNIPMTPASVLGADNSGMTPPMWGMKCPKCDVVIDWCMCGKPKGVGERLEEMIPDFFKYTGCNCTAYARSLDSIGPDECENRKQEIIDHLVEKAESFYVPNLLARPAAEKWVTHAIADAKRDFTKWLKEREKRIAEIRSDPRKAR